MHKTEHCVCAQSLCTREYCTYRVYFTAAVLVMHIDFT